MAELENHGYSVKNNLKEQLALHRANNAKEKIKPLRKSSCFKQSSPHFTPPPHKVPLTFSSSTKARPQSSLSFSNTSPSNSVARHIPRNGSNGSKSSSFGANINASPQQKPTPSVESVTPLIFQSSQRSFCFKHLTQSSPDFTPPPHKVPLTSSSLTKTRPQSSLSFSNKSSNSVARHIPGNGSNSSLFGANINASPQQKPTPSVESVTPLISQSSQSTPLTPVHASSYSEGYSLMKTAPGTSLADCIPPSTTEQSSNYCHQGDSQSSLQSKLDRIKEERLSVMDDICEMLFNPPSTFTSNCQLHGGRIQRKLTVRKKLLLKEEDLKRRLQATLSSVKISPTLPSPTLHPNPPSGDSSTVHARTNSSLTTATTAASTETFEEYGDMMIDEIEELMDEDWKLNTEASPVPSLPEPVSSSTPCLTHNVSSSHNKSSFKPPFLESRKLNTFKPAAPQDDASEFRGQYPHTREMYKVFSQVFGLKLFRPNQLEAVNAVILKKDCFVLMPTGGGKSLCYQLPALMTHGVTVVVSPLRSLIQDQVMKLTSLGIPAHYLSSDLSLSDERKVYAALYLREPIVKLLYVTPEKLGASNKLVSTLQGLHNRQRLPRFVIDEAHCISQWGHDFRPDYKKLSKLRQKFPDVPIVALTATATPRVRADILYQLNIQRTCKWFTQSFNRTNLQYRIVAKKPKKVIQDIIELISGSLSGLSGIIYCLSRRDCELVAGELCKGNIAALCYHAGLSNEERSLVQQRWVQEDRCKVVCATIAFGMGIDKHDVRFVIHHSMPKSIEGYYQEAGRAGRDGLPAQCILFYSYSDMGRLRRMVKAEKLRYEQEKVHMDNLYRMVQYCENVTDCRRVQLLEYFAEKFDSSLCKNGNTPCDNCQSSVPFITDDVTDLVKVIVESVLLVGNDKYTLNQFVDAIKGSNSKKIASGELGTLPLYGKGSNKTKHDVERLLHMLVMKDILSESITIGNHDNVVCYVKAGSKAMDVCNGKITGIILKVKGNGKTSSASKTSTKSMSKEDKLKADCYKALNRKRISVSMKHKMKNPEYVISSTSLRAMSNILPTSKEEMLSIEGYTEVRWMKYDGEEFLSVIQEYAREIAKAKEESDKISPYFNKENQCIQQPILGKRKRKKKEASDDSPKMKKQAFIINLDSEDEFEIPTTRKPLTLLHHPNN